MSVPSHLILRVAACLSAACLSASCNTSDARAQQAMNAYQAAAAGNDMLGARKALLDLVRAKDDVSEYWVELGKVQASLGSFGDAYYAFNRAYELDRGNAQLLSIVTQLALRSGDIALAQSRAKDLEVLAPNDPWVKLTAGWAAISQSRYDDAIAASDSLLSATPYDPVATQLKARALIGAQRIPEAVELLEKQIAAQPSDQGSLELLSRVYERRNDWHNAAKTALRLQELTPGNAANSLLLIRTAFLSGDKALGRKSSRHLLQPNASPATINAVLDLWSAYWHSPQRTLEAKALAGTAQGVERKLVYAAFLNRTGDPESAMRISAEYAGLPVKAANAEANAVIGDSWARAGKLADAKRRLDAVIAFDPGNATALRSRAELALRTGKAKEAVIDAQKLVTVLPQSPLDRLLLVRSFTAAGDQRWAERTLWSAFQEIPGEPRIFAALVEQRRGNNEAIIQLREEFARQMDKKLGQGLL